MTTMTTIHENAIGKYFWTRHQVTSIYQVIEERQLGTSGIKYLLSTGKNIKASFNNLAEAVQEANRRQAWADAR